MGLFSKSLAQVEASWRRATALVIAADVPPQGAPSRGPYAHGTLQVFVDTPDRGRRTLTADLPYAAEHWVVPGMELPIAFDPAQPDRFAVDWAAVPTMPQQVAANHPALADPFGAARHIAATVGITPSVKTAARLERFQQAVAAAASRSAPPGRFPAVAMTVSVRGRFSGNDSDADGPGSNVLFTESSAAVLSIARPGQPPYAVYQPKFKIPRKRRAIPGEPMPATVAATDPLDVEIVWDELPGLDDQIAARIADAASANAARTAALGQQFRAATAQAMAAHQLAAQQGIQPPGPTGMPPQMRQMLVENLRRSLLYVTDPAQRNLVLQQYRAMGLDVSTEELGL